MKLPFPLLAARRSALAGFGLGAIHAAILFWSRRYILDFQAGDGSTFGERFEATVHTAAIEGVGFGVVGLVLGLLTALTVRGNDAESNRRRIARFWTLATAFFAWRLLAWVAEDVLPFLTKRDTIVVSILGFIGAFVGYQLFRAVARALKRTAGRDELTECVAALVAASGALALASWVVLGVSGGFRSPVRLGIGAAAFVVAFAVLPRLGAPIEALLARLRRIADAPGVTRASVALTWVLSIALVASIAVMAPKFSLSAVERKKDYTTATPLDVAEPPTNNIVFVTIDTLRADHLSCYGYDRPTSPFIDSIASEGVRFADPVAAAAWTKPATGTIFTGLYPSRHGALYHGSSLQLPEGMRTVAEEFRSRGYVTAGFVSNPNIKAIFDFDRGFDEFFDSPVDDTLTLACIRASWIGHIAMDLLRHQFNWKYENDVMQMNEHALAWLEKNHERPFFLYVHYIDPHIPYDPPARWRAEFEQDHGFPILSERKRLVGRDLYDAEIRYTDEGIAQFVEGLKRLGVWDDTLFVLTSDHGEEFFEHEVLGHGFSLFQPVVQVPLIVRAPKDDTRVTPGTVVEHPVQIVDLAATVFELAGTGLESFGDGHSFARSIWDPSWTPDRPYFLENEFGQDDSNHRAFVFNGVRDGSLKLVLTEQNAFFPPQLPENDSEALYDLSTDPGETTNLITDPAFRARADEMLNRLREHAAFLFETGFRDVEPSALTDEVRANLEALGY